MKTLICFLEEPSAEEMLKGVLPRILPDGITFECIVFEGKQDLEKKITNKLRYWQRPDSVFMVMRDKDNGDCGTVKKNLSAKVSESGKQDLTMVRIACSELESFYLGDLEAVELGLKIRNLARKQNKSKYRIPDRLSNACEELTRLTEGLYQKVAGSRAIGPHLKIDGSNRSRSFNVLLSGIKKLTGLT